MHKYSEVVGLPVICVDTGKKVGLVKDIIFCPGSKEIKAFIIERSSYEIKRKLVLPEDVLNIGHDAVIINSASNLKNLKDMEKKGDLRDKGEVLGLRVYTVNGEDLGVVKDILFDCDSGLIEGVEISDGLLQDIVKGRNIIPLFGKVEFSSENILIGKEALEEMTGTGGGLKKRFLEE